MCRVSAYPAVTDAVPKDVFYHVFFLEIQMYLSAIIANMNQYQYSALDNFGYKSGYCSQNKVIWAGPTLLKNIATIVFTMSRKKSFSYLVKMNVAQNTKWYVYFLLVFKVLKITLQCISYLKG